MEQAAAGQTMMNTIEQKINENRHSCCPRIDSEPKIEVIIKLQEGYQKFVSASKTKNENLLNLASILLNHIKAGQEYKPSGNMNEEEKKFVRSRLLTLIFASIRALKENESMLRKLSANDDVINKISVL